MADSDELRGGIKINGEYFDSLAALGAFISQNYPEKLEDFQQKYGKHSSS
jgi:hypothetical protein